MPEPVEVEGLGKYDPDRYQPEHAGLVAAYRAEHPDAGIGPGFVPRYWSAAGVTLWLQVRSAVRAQGLAVPKMRPLDHMYLRAGTVADEVPRHLLEAEGIDAGGGNRG